MGGVIVPLNAEWVLSLLEQGEPETQTLDYKRQAYSTEDKGRKDFATDIAALANANGGILLIGMDEDEVGRAQEICPLTGNEDAEKQRIHQWLHRQIEPKLRTYEVITIAVEGGFVMAIQIPQQFYGPFQAKHGNWTRFPVRIGTITMDLNYNQLANAFGQQSRIASEMRAWRAARLNWLQEWIGVRLREQSWGFLHAMPLSAFSEAHRVDWGGIRRNPIQIRGYQANTRFNADGLLATMQPNPSAEPRDEYVQFFRNGCVEYAWHIGTRNAELPHVRGIRSAHVLLDILPTIASAMDTVELSSSVAIGISFVKIQGKHLEDYSEQGGWIFDGRSEAFPDGALVLDELLLPDVATLADVAKYLPDQFTDICRAFGLDECNYFDESGAIAADFHRYTG